MALQQRIIPNVRVTDMPRHGDVCRLPSGRRFVLTNGMFRTTPFSPIGVVK